MISFDKLFSAIDKTLENDGRKNIIGTLVTGIGATITAVGAAILCTNSHVEKPKLEDNNSVEENP